MAAGQHPPYPPPPAESPSPAVDLRDTDATVAKTAAQSHPVPACRLVASLSQATGAPATPATPVHLPIMQKRRPNVGGGGGSRGCAVGYRSRMTLSPIPLPFVLAFRPFSLCVPVLLSFRGCPSCSSVVWLVRDGTRQDRTGDRTGQDRTVQDKTGRKGSGQDGTEMDGTGQDGKDGTEMDGRGQDGTGLGVLPIVITVLTAGQCSGTDHQSSSGWDKRPVSWVKNDPAAQRCKYRRQGEAPSTELRRRRQWTGSGDRAWVGVPACHIARQLVSILAQTAG